MNNRSALTPAILAVAIIVVGSWVLNNTAIGLNVKCRVFNDLGSCIVVVLTQPIAPNPGRGVYTPPPTETPEELAARQAAERQARLDASVQSVSSTLSQAMADASNTAEEMKSDAADMTSAVRDVASSINDEMQSAYRNLKTQTRVTPMDDVAQSDECVALYDVGVARDDVGVAVDDFGVVVYPYESAQTSWTDEISVVQSAETDLNAAVAVDSTGIHPQYTTADADAALLVATGAVKIAAAEASKAKAAVVSLVKSADALMTKATKLAATVASC